MRSLSETVPLGAYRVRLQRYLGSADFAFDSVAGQIIAERLPIVYAGDPVRPSLVLWACAANDGAIADALPVAAAFDLFDRFMLLHDELAHDSGESIGRWGLGQSLNAGDALYAVAFRSLASDVVHPEQRLHAARIVGEAVLEAIEGRSNSTRGSALTGAALQAGAVIAGAPDALAETFAQAGRTLGMAGDCADATEACRLAMDSVASLRDCTDRADLDSYLEVARYIARRAA